MRSFTVKASTEYEVLMGSGLLSEAGSLIKKVLPKAETLAVITDDKVGALYGGEDQALMKSLSDAGYTLRKYTFPNGEASKKMDTVCGMLEFLASGENALTRSDAIVALGGGVTGDMAGLAAALYMRGINFVQIPTSLLAAVDSSVGGKTGVDLTAGKNLAGAFWQPSLVIYDTDTADTLEKDQIMDGLAEAVKSGIIADPSLFTYIRDNSEKLKEYMDDTGIRGEDFHRLIETVAFRSADVKRIIVEKDEKESGERQLLNLGHTFGHAIEKLSGYGTSHGLAVAKGTALIAEASAAAGMIPAASAEEIISALAGLGYDLSCPYRAEDLAEAALSDKKRRGSEITLVIPEKVGRCSLRRIQTAGLKDLIRSALEA